MFRTLFYLIAAVLIITVLRMVIGRVMRGAAQALRDGGARRPPSSASPGGELKRDPVCGTYVAESASIKRSVSGQVYHFCSPECRDKFQA
ncbi:MAG TPA: YHS domain-containing protein [Bryobacteraceae bacterium]|nr:YHS domain-containing protein [Bryobacteraceae bacterium]